MSPLIIGLICGVVFGFGLGYLIGYQIAGKLYEYDLEDYDRGMIKQYGGSDESID